jgi:hypothetical protein
MDIGDDQLSKCEEQSYFVLKMDLKKINEHKLKV